MKAGVLKFLLLCIVCLLSSNAMGKDWMDVPGVLTQKIPLRRYWAMTGSEFARYIFKMDQTLREQTILNQFLEGNLPDFLRKLTPVNLRQRFKDGEVITATIFAMPDYLAIGSNQDFIRIPMNLYTAAEIANKFGFILPTKKIVNAIFKQSAFRLEPQPMAPGPQMTSTAYYLAHNEKIKKQRSALQIQLGALISGHKKDVVMTNRLAGRQGKIAIYGWHRPSGNPIQPLCTVHGAGYADYSHGVRLISNLAWVNGEPASVCAILEDPRRADLLSDEGTIPLRRILTPYLDLQQGEQAANNFSIPHKLYKSIRNLFSQPASKNPADPGRIPHEGVRTGL